MTLQVFNALVGVAALVALTGSVVLVKKSPRLGIWALLITAALEASSLGASIDVGSIRITAIDTVVAVLAAALLVKLIGHRLRLGMQIWVLSALLGLAIFRGVSIFGVEQAVNGSRVYLHFFVALAFARSMGGMIDFPVFEKAWRSVAIVLCIAALGFLATEGLGTYAATGDRALNAPQALLVAQAAVMVLVSGARLRYSGLALAMFGIVLLSQQRTVWLTTAMMIAVVVFRYGKLRDIGSARTLKVVALAGIVLSVGLVVAAPAELRDSTEQAVTTVSAESGTFGWRLEGWIELVEQFSSAPLGDMLWGQPMGAGYGRKVGAGFVEVSPHNMYIAILLSFGVLGLGAFLLLLAKALKASKDSVILVALTAGLLVFGIGYQLLPEHGLIVGWALSMGSRADRNTDSGAGVRVP